MSSFYNLNLPLPFQKTHKPRIFFLLDKEKGGSLTANDFEVAAKYGK